MLNKLAKKFKQISVIYCLFILLILFFENYICGVRGELRKKYTEIFNKCCREDQSFDFNLRICVEGQLPGAAKVDFTENFLNCSEVIVEREGTNLTQLLQNVQEYKYCIDGNDEFWILRTCEPENICRKNIPCVRKCCEHGQKYKGSNRCVAHFGSVKPIFHNIVTKEAVNVTEFGILAENKCQKYILEPLNTPEDVHYFSYIDGTLHIAGSKRPFNHDEYCIENLDADGRLTLEVFACFNHNDNDTSHPFLLYGIGMAISATFFALTALVYLSIPKLMNLHGKTLVANVTSFCIAYMTLTINSFRTEYVSVYFCPIYAYIIYYSLMSGFLWLNVMCIDIWLSFGTIRAPRLKSEKRRRFYYYCAYACSVPFVLTAVMLGLQYGKIGDSWRPKLGEEKCWFNSSDLAYFIFFLIPVGLLTLCNVILFILTAIHCNKVKAEINRMQLLDGEKKRRFIADKTRFCLIARLFIVMGTSWALELASSVVPSPRYIWYVPDIFNASLGVFVFGIFVCKRKVWIELQQLFGLKVKRRVPPSGATDSTSLRTTQLQKASSTTTISAITTSKMN